MKKGTIPKILFSILAAVLILMGGVWFLQGINILPGSFMTGRSEWAIYGGIAILAGVAVLMFAFRRRASPPAP